jgi:hypothetical protein
MIKKHSKHKSFSCFIKIMCICIAFIAVFFLQIASSNAQASSQPPPVSGVNFENNKMYIGVWLNNIYSYQYTTGSYTIDMYLYFFWVDPNITAVDWYLINGYTVNPATSVLISSDLTSDVKYQIYRITAACSSAPDAKDFPFDTIKIEVAIELLTHGNKIEFVWLDGETGIDPNFINAGWVTTDLKLTTASHVYPLNAELPRAELVVTQQRQMLISNVQNLIPPTIFAIVSAFSFLFSLRDASAVGLRLGLNTSMLVTTLLFNFTVGTVVPPSSTITIYGLFIFAVLIFIVMNLIVTIAGFVQWFYYKNERQTKITNRWGFILSLIVPVVFFLLILLLRA